MGERRVGEGRGKETKEVDTYSFGSCGQEYKNYDTRRVPRSLPCTQDKHYLAETLCMYYNDI